MPTAQSIVAGNKRPLSSMSSDPDTSSPMPPEKYKLPIPEPTKDLVTIAKQLQNLCDATKTGKSLVAITASNPYKVSRSRTALNVDKTLEEKVISEMTPVERLQYDAWKTNPITLPPIDWTQDQLPPPRSNVQLKRYRVRAEALNRLYDTDRATIEHVAWITQNQISMLPLVKAIARIIGAETDARQGYSPAVLAEVQILNEILAVSGKVVSNGHEGRRSEAEEVTKRLHPYFVEMRRQIRTTRGKADAAL
ncbi:hypothetical protein LTR66_004761 [Elasticomyces elasticus]|nr:hypothetical protein LTR66_004761 [Elasticomyces elasticus]KAK5011256.1 hypothetical protein LTR28_004479 [Elasticomyces elasticus]